MKIELLKKNRVSRIVPYMSPQPPKSIILSTVSKDSIYLAASIQDKCGRNVGLFIHSPGFL